MSNPTFKIYIDDTYTTELSTNSVYTNSLTPLYVKSDSDSAYSQSLFVWDFGDGNVGEGESVSHVYSDVGEFEVKLTRYQSDGSSVTSDPVVITALNLIPNLMEINSESHSTGFQDASQPNPIPYIIDTYNSWQQYNEDSKLGLYAEDSKSLPFDFDDKFAHLKPTWGFFDADNNRITEAKLEQTKLYATYNGTDQIYIEEQETTDSVFVGTKSRTEFYFIDDSPSGIDTTADTTTSTNIVVSQLLPYEDEVDGVYNTILYPSILIPVFINNTVPVALDITTNGIFEMPYVNFANTRIPFMVRLIDEFGNYVKTNPTIGSEGNPGFVDVIIDGEVEYLDTPPLSGELETFLPDFSNLGGYYQSYFVPTTSSNGELQLSADTTVDIVLSNATTRFGVFSDESSNNIYRVSYIDDVAISYIRKLDEVVNNEYDGLTSNKFGSTVDALYNSYFLDSDDSRMEIYDTSFTLLSAYELSGYAESIENHSSPAQMCLDQDNNQFITLHDATKILYKDADGFFSEVIAYPNILNNVVIDDTGGLSSISDIIEGIVLDGSETVTNGEGYDVAIRPTALEILSDNDTLYTSYVLSNNVNYIEKYTIDRTSVLSLSATNTIELSGNQAVDMVSTKDGSKLYVLEQNYITSESWVNTYDTVTDSLVDEVFVGYSAEFITIDSDQKAWTVAKSDKDSPIFDNLFSVDEVSNTMYSTDEFIFTTSDVYIEKIEVKKRVPFIGGNDFVIYVNEVAVVDLRRNFYDYPSDYVWVYEGIVERNDTIRVGIWDGWAGTNAAPWEMTLYWSDGFIQTVDGGEQKSLDPYVDPPLPRYPEDAPPGMTEEEWRSEPRGEYYSAPEHISDSEVTRTRNDIIDDGIVDMTHIGGIAGSSDGTIWLLDSMNDRVIVFNKDDISDFNTVIITEDNPSVQNQYVAYGDWTGFRWYNKFGEGGIIQTVELSGVSEEFCVLNSGKYNLEKVNEDFDMTETLKSYRTTEAMLNYDHLFDDFLGSIYGNKYDDGTFFGRNYYERVANFVMNHADIDTCTVDSLESFCLETGVSFDEDIVYPRDIKNLVDLYSIEFKKLWGDDYISPLIEEFRGNEIDESVYIVNEGVNLIAVEKFNDKHNLIRPVLIDESSTYPLSAYEDNWGWGLSVPSGEDVFRYYDFYELEDPTVERTQGVIDWENELTDTSIKPLSSFEDYMTDNGIVSVSLGDTLRQGLGLYLD